MRPNASLLLFPQSKRGAGSFEFEVLKLNLVDIFGLSFVGWLQVVVLSRGTLLTAVGLHLLFCYLVFYVFSTGPV